jgi:hypothetical protein
VWNAPIPQTNHPHNRFQIGAQSISGRRAITTYRVSTRFLLHKVPRSQAWSMTRRFEKGRGLTGSTRWRMETRRGGRRVRGPRGGGAGGGLGFGGETPVCVAAGKMMAAAGCVRPTGMMWTWDFWRRRVGGVPGCVGLPGDAKKVGRRAISCGLIWWPHLLLWWKRTEPFRYILPPFIIIIMWCTSEPL